MAIIKWDPFKDLATLRERLDRVFEEPFPRWDKDRELFSADWSPSVDIHETEKALTITAEVPGLDDKDIEVEIEGHQLILKGKKEFEKETKKEDYHRIERSYGSFCRSFALPDYVDVDKVEAHHEKGLLKITLPKKPELKPKKVKILASGTSKK
jgi:HSP20 family protein